jgi:hypothetical protein
MTATATAHCTTAAARMVAGGAAAHCWPGHVRMRAVMRTATTAPASRIVQQCEELRSPALNRPLVPEQIPHREHHQAQTRAVA